MTAKPCSEPAVGAVLVFARGSKAVRVRVGAQGRYSVRLAPGTYLVHELPRPKAGFGIAPDRVVVTRSMRADFFIDTGIR
jgi:hypothetical protein